MFRYVTVRLVYPDDIDTTVFERAADVVQGTDAGVLLTYLS